MCIRDRVHVVVTANSGEVGKVSDDCGLLAAEGQVDEIFQLEQLQLVGHGLKLRGLAGVEAFQDVYKRQSSYRASLPQFSRLSKLSCQQALRGS